MKDLILRVLYRLLLFPVALLLAPLIWAGGMLLAMGAAGDPAVAWVGRYFPDIPGIYEIGFQGAKEVWRLFLAGAGLALMGVGYFPTYDLWLRGCVPKPEEVKEEELEGVIP